MKMNKSGAVINSPTPSTKLSYSIKKIRQPVCPPSKPKRSTEFDSDEEIPRENEMSSRMKGLEDMMEKLINETITINKTIVEMATKPKSSEKVDENLTSEPQPISGNVVIEGRKLYPIQRKSTQRRRTQCEHALQPIE
jgi:hypothetical protein